MQTFIWFCEVKDWVEQDSWGKCTGNGEETRVVIHNNWGNIGSFSVHIFEKL